MQKRLSLLCVFAMLKCFKSFVSLFGRKTLFPQQKRLSGGQVSLAALYTYPGQPQGLKIAPSDRDQSIIHFASHITRALFSAGSSPILYYITLIFLKTTLSCLSCVLERVMYFCLTLREKSAT
jgi:hypothetical protein